MQGVWSRGSKTKRKTKEDLEIGCQRGLSSSKLNTEDAMDHSKWRKLIKDVRWSRWVWVGECFFWYQSTRVVPDQRPLNGCVCACVVFWCLCTAVGLCCPRHRHLAASVQGKLRVDYTQRQFPRGFGSLHCGWRAHPYHWILRLLWSDHGEPVYAYNGQCSLHSHCNHTLLFTGHFPSVLTVLRSTSLSSRKPVNPSI